MSDPTLPLPTEPVPYFDPTAMTPLPDLDETRPAGTPPGHGPPTKIAPVAYAPAEVAPVSVEPAAYAPPVVSGPPVVSAPPRSLVPYAHPAERPKPQQRPAPLPVPGPPPPIVAQIGDVRVSSTTIYTPIGEFPLRGSQWTVTDQWHTTQKTPTWAIVLAIVLFFCLTVFSLFFLLAKEIVYSGMVQVVITNGSRQYVTRIPVTSQIQVSQLHQQVNYVRSLATL